MKEKYYVRLVCRSEGFPADFVFGLSWDGLVITVGGPAAFREKILETVRDVFEEYFGIEHNHGRRFIAVAKRVSEAKWAKGFAVLKERFAVTPTRRFRRLMR